ncbi:MAG: hypothetical protein ACAI43_27065 [Phycisphaerae bacterium]|nr:hypothetical protein [Tepidisphaeraceae bacterium]
MSPVVESLEVRQFMSMIAPTSLAADDVSGSQLDVTFTNANTQTDADWIYIERSQDNGANRAQIGYLSPDVGTMTYHDTNRFPGGAYVYRARAALWDGGLSDYTYSSYSGTDSAEIDLAAPTGLSAAVVSGNGIQLSFTNNADNAEYMQVERSVDGGTTWANLTALSPFPGTVTHTDTPVYPGSAYKYRVRAYVDDQDRAQAVWSAYTNVATATVALNAPLNLTATTVDADTVRVAFDSYADNADNILIERSDDGGVNWDQVASLTPTIGRMSFDDADLDPDVYQYRARAHAWDDHRSRHEHTSYTDVAGATIYSTPPTLSVTPSTTTPDVGDTVTLYTSYSGSGSGTIDHWTIDWGDGTGAEVVAGNPGSATHVYWVDGDFEIKATATNADGTFAAPPEDVTAAPILPAINLQYEVTVSSATIQGNDDSVNLAITIRRLDDQAIGINTTLMVTLTFPEANGEVLSFLSGGDRAQTRTVAVTGGSGFVTVYRIPSNTASPNTTVTLTTKTPGASNATSTVLIKKKFS